MPNLQRKTSKMYIQPFYYCEACKTEHLVPPADFHADRLEGADDE